MLFTRRLPAALGAGALGLFTLLTTFVGHPFWNESGMSRFNNLNSFLEHFGLIGGFGLVVLWEMGRSARLGTDAITDV